MKFLSVPQFLVLIRVPPFDSYERLRTDQLFYIYVYLIITIWDEDPLQNVSGPGQAIISINDT